MARADRRALLNALKSFEQAAEKPDYMSQVSAAVKWDEVLHKHEVGINAKTLLQYKKRAQVALQKALNI